MKDKDDQDTSPLIARPALLVRWGLRAPLTLRRMEKRGLLTPIKLTPKVTLYERSQVERLEAQARGTVSPTTPTLPQSGKALRPKQQTVTGSAPTREDAKAKAPEFDESALFGLPPID